MRIAGSLLIAVACLIYCLRFVRQSRRRLRELDSAARLLSMMSAELEARLTPLPELTRRLQDSAQEPAKGFLNTLSKELTALGEKSFSDIWRDSALDSFPMLEADELAALTQLGCCLGRYEIASQLAALELCAGTLRGKAALCRTELPERRRLHLGLACSAAALLVVVLY